MEYDGIMFERLNDTYLKAKGKKYIAAELRESNWEEGIIMKILSILG